MTQENKDNKCFICKKNTYSKKCIFSNCGKCCPGQKDDAFCPIHYEPPKPPPEADSYEVENFLQTINIFYKDINSLIVDYFDENALICSTCDKKETNHNDTHVDTCHNCGIMQCWDCGMTDVNIYCKMRDCHYCTRGWCFNNKTEYYCSECYISESESDSDLNSRDSEFEN